MTFYSLKEFGSILTGREYGKTVYQSIQPKLVSPIGLDFGGVETMGSSFGDEVVVPIAQSQNGQICVRNANSVVSACLMDIADENKLTIDHVK